MNNNISKYGVHVWAYFLLYPTTSAPLNPLAKGLNSIFNCVICRSGWEETVIKDFYSGHHTEVFNLINTPYHLTQAMGKFTDQTNILWDNPTHATSTIPPS